MKKILSILVTLVVAFVFTTSISAESVPVKCGRETCGEVEYTVSEGSYSSRPGWGQTINVELYNDSDKTVFVTVTLKGNGKKRSTTIKPYDSDTVILNYEEGENYYGVKVNVAPKC